MVNLLLTPLKIPSAAESPIPSESNGPALNAGGYVPPHSPYSLSPRLKYKCLCYLDALLSPGEAADSQGQGVAERAAVAVGGDGAAVFLTQPPVWGFNRALY